MANSDWRMVFSGGHCSCTAEIFGAQGAVWKVRILPNPKFFGTSEDVHYSFVACFSRLRLYRHRLRVGGQIGRVRLLPSQNDSEWRIANSERFFLKGIVPALPKKFRSCGSTTLQSKTPKLLKSCESGSYLSATWRKHPLHSNGVGQKCVALEKRYQSQT